MSIVSNIFFSYFSPIKIFNTRVKTSNDSQLFGVLVVGCLFTLIGQFPPLYNLSKSIFFSNFTFGNPELLNKFIKAFSKLG